MSRISPFRLNMLPESALEIIGNLPPIHVFKTMGHLGETFTIWVKLIIALNKQNQISDRQLEIAIMHASNQEKGEYEWVQHLPLAQKAGVTQSQLSAIENGDYSAEIWPDEGDRALLYYLQQVVKHTKADDACWQNLRNYFSEAQIIELTLLHGTYRTLCAINVNAETPMDASAAEQAYQILEGSK